MTKAKSSLKHKILMGLYISFAVIFLVLIGFGFFYGRKVLYQRYPDYTAMSQKAVLDETNVKDSDSLYVKKLKGKALDSYLETASLDLASQLADNEKEVTAILAGTLTPTDYQRVKSPLQKAMSATTDEMEQLDKLYQNARLNNSIKQAQSEATTLNLASLESYYQTLNQLAQLAQEDLTKSDLADDPNIQASIQASIDTLNAANSTLDNFSQFIQNTNHYNSIDLASYQAVSTDGPLMQSLLPVYDKVSHFLSQKATIASQIANIQALQEKVKASQDLTSQSLPLDNFVGMTLKAVKEKMQVAGYQTSLAPNNEADENSLVTRQVPSPAQYSRIMKGQTVILYTKEKVVEKPDDKAKDKAKAEDKKAETGTSSSSSSPTKKE